MRLSKDIPLEIVWTWTNHCSLQGCPTMYSWSREECPGTSQEARTFLMGSSEHQVTLADRDMPRLSWDIHVDLMNIKSSLGCMFGPTPSLEKQFYPCSCWALYQKGYDLTFLSPRTCHFMQETPNRPKTVQTGPLAFSLQLGVLCHETVGRLSRQHTLGLASIIAPYSPMQKNCTCALSNACCIIAIAIVKIKCDSHHVIIFVQA